MAGGYCLNWTPWRVWLHPHRAAERLEEAQQTEEELQSRLSETLNLLEQQRKETAMQTLRASDMSRQLGEAEQKLTDRYRELEETRIQLSKALDSLAEHKSVDEKLREFDRELEKVEQMKRGYEKRIAELQARLANAHKRLGDADSDELAEPIDMLEATRQQALIRKKMELKNARPVPKAKPAENTANPSAAKAAEALEAHSDPAAALADALSAARPKFTADTANPPEPPKTSISQPTDTRKANRRYDDWLSELPDF